MDTSPMVTKEELMVWIEDLLAGSRSAEIRISPRWRSFDSFEQRTSLSVEFIDNGEVVQTFAIATRPSNEERW
jgi:hypothetical protein